jgi:hypothetical protein
VGRIRQRDRADRLDAALVFDEQLVLAGLVAEIRDELAVRRPRRVALGRTRFEIGDPTGARLAFDRAASLEPVRIPVGLARAEFLGSIGELDLALQQLVLL